MKIFSAIGKIGMTMITVFLALIFISNFFAIGEDLEYYDESILEVQDFTLEPIGTIYQDEEAEEGYSYYRMLIDTENISHFGAYSNYLWRYYEDADGYQLVDTQENGRNNPYYYENQERIPAGRKAVLEDILLIEDGVHRVRVRYSSGYEEKEKEWIVSLPE